MLEANPNSLSPSPTARAATVASFCKWKHRGVKTLRSCHHAPSHQQVPGRARSFILQYLVDFPYQIFVICLINFWIKACRPNSLIYLRVSFWERERRWTWLGKSNGIQLHSIFPLAPLTQVFIFSCNFMHVYFIMSSEYNHWPQPHELDVIFP